MLKTSGCTMDTQQSCPPKATWQNIQPEWFSRTVGRLQVGPHNVGEPLGRQGCQPGLAALIVQHHVCRVNCLDVRDEGAWMRKHRVMHVQPSMAPLMTSPMPAQGLCRSLQQLPTQSGRVSARRESLTTNTGLCPDVCRLGVVGNPTGPLDLIPDQVRRTEYSRSKHGYYILAPQ